MDPAAANPVTQPPAPPPKQPPAIGEIFSPPVQTFLFLVLFALVGIVAWKSFRNDRADAIASPHAFKVDINRADRAELMLLPGIGPGLADRILDYRATNGPFDGLTELRNISGLGPATLEKIRPYLVLSWPEGRPASRAGTPVLSVSSPKYAKTSKTGLGSPIDLNNATLEELQHLPGIGPKLAQRIVDTRENRPFVEIADVRRVPGIGPKTLDKLRPYVTLGTEATVTAKVQ